MNVREESEKLLKLFRQFDGKVPDEEMISLLEKLLRIAILDGKEELLNEMITEQKHG